MPSPGETRATVSSWRELYLAAIFERDSSQLSARVARAEQAIVARGRELFHLGQDDVDESEALDSALYALSALKSAELHNPSRSVPLGSAEKLVPHAPRGGIDNLLQ